MILLISDPYDLHADRVRDDLARKGYACARFNTVTYPAQSVITLTQGDVDDLAYLETEGRRIHFHEVRTVWNRRPAIPRIQCELDPHDRDLVFNEAHHVLRSLSTFTSDAFWVNPYWAEKAAQVKPHQLFVARECGLKIPKTLITSNPEEALEFCERCNGDVIYKSLSNHVRDCGTTGYGIYTTRLERRQLMDFRAGIRLAPCQFQEYIQKKVELRITIIGDKVFAAEIDSQVSDRSRVDWRRGLGECDLPHRVYNLPIDTERRLLALTERLGLVFGCADAIVTPKGEIVFLEINTQGQWAWIEDETGMPLLDAFTDLLIMGTQTHQRVSMS